MSELFKIDPNQADVWDRNEREILRLDVVMSCDRRKDRKFKLNEAARQRANGRENFGQLFTATLMDQTNGEDRDVFGRETANENTGWFGMGKDKRMKSISLGNGWVTERSS